VTAAQRNKLHKRLASLERELSGKSLVKIRPNRSEEEDASAAEDEQPLNEMLQTIASSQNKNRDALWARVRHALQKIAETPAEFGLCEECGEGLPAGRLEAMPYAELCVTCQAQKDGPRAGPTRRKLTDFQ
jgi:DnaK suppressor protein